MQTQLEIELEEGRKVLVQAQLETLTEMLNYVPARDQLELLSFINLMVLQRLMPRKGEKFN